MPLDIDPLSSSQFEAAKNSYKASLSYMIQCQKNLEQEEQTLSNLITQGLPLHTQRFEKFRANAEDASTKWSHFKANEIPAYYSVKHEEIILRTDTAFHRIFNSSEKLLQEAKEKGCIPTLSSNE